MAQSDDQGDKTEEPTQKKLSDARDRGQVPLSREVNAFAVLLAGTIAVLAMAPTIGRELAEIFTPFIARPHAIAVDFESLRVTLLRAFGAVGVALGGAAALIMIGALGGGLIQHGGVLSAELVKPQWSRISPLAGFKRIFSPRTLVEFVKNLLKLTVVAAVAIYVVFPDLDLMSLMIRAEPMLLLDTLWWLSVKLLGGVAATMAVIAGLDFLYQRFDFTRGQRMSRHEIREEFRQMEGDPLIKARLRSIRAEKARRRMIAAVPGADVVITNPTHYAVALKYDQAKMEAPTVVAKGVDHMARRIREVALEHKVPLVENPPLTRALYQAVEVDQSIPTEHYKAVAEIIGFVWRMKKKTGAGAGAGARRPGT